MDPTDLSDDQLDQLAQQLAGRLPTGTHGDRVVLTRRQFAAASAGVLSTGALMALGVDEATAQAAGQVGTESSPVDVEANLINGGGPIVDGDGIAREQYLIANGAGDPADANADDLIYEEEA